MGVTVESKNHSIDLGYGGFNKLRGKVAELTGDEIGEHYKVLERGMFLFGEEKTVFFKDYNQKITELAEKHQIPHGILDFLYASAGSGKISASKCKQIYEVIKDYNDDILYGYRGRPDCAKFVDFKEIVADCVENKCSLQWW